MAPYSRGFSVWHGIISNMKAILVLVLVCVVATVGYVVVTGSDKAKMPMQGEVKIVDADYKNIAYTIEGTSVRLTNGYNEFVTAPNSASKVITRYSGNELITDLDDDGDNDVAFVVTQETGGSGVFY